MLEPSTSVRLHSLSARCCPTASWSSGGSASARPARAAGERPIITVPLAKGVELLLEPDERLALLSIGIVRMAAHVSSTPCAFRNKVKAYEDDLSLASHSALSAARSPPVSFHTRSEAPRSSCRMASIFHSRESTARSVALRCSAGARQAARRIAARPPDAATSRAPDFSRPSAATQAVAP